MNTYEVTASWRTRATITVTVENEDIARQAARVVLQYSDYDQDDEVRYDFNIDDVDLVSGGE